MQKLLVHIAMLTMPLILCGQSAWTLDFCIEQALNNNISIQKSRIDQNVSEVSLKQQQGGYQPSISFSSGHNYTHTPFPTLGYGYSTSGSGLEADNAVKHHSYSGNIGINLNWTIWNGSRQPQIEQARINLRRAGLITNQMENVSDGAINRTTVLITLALGNGIAIVLSVLRIYFGVEFSLLYIVVPGYILAFALSFAVPDIYTAMAFDSGGVVSGPMNTTFILPFAIGACYSMWGNDLIMTNAFGTIAVVALMPLIMIQLLGLSASIKIAAQYRIARNRVREEFDDQIIHF